MHDLSARTKNIEEQVKKEIEILREAQSVSHKLPIASSRNKR